jgi:hypothetical protein
MSVLTRPRKSQTGGSVARVTPSASLAIAWIPPAQIDRGSWVAAGRRIGEYGRVSNWWVGDWLHYGAARWGEKYVEASRITGLDAKTLRNIAYVAARFDLSRRRDKLTWTHHAEVAALDASDQEVWLDRALEERMSATDLRVALRSSQKSDASVCVSDQAHEDAEPAITCPNCAQSIPTALLIVQPRKLARSVRAAVRVQQDTASH